jgi:hypothetical protein
LYVLVLEETQIIVWLLITLNESFRLKALIIVPLHKCKCISQRLFLSLRLWYQRHTFGLGVTVFISMKMKRQLRETGVIVNNIQRIIFYPKVLLGHLLLLYLIHCFTGLEFFSFWARQFWSHNSNGCQICDTVFLTWTYEHNIIMDLPVSWKKFIELFEHNMGPYCAKWSLCSVPNARQTMIISFIIIVKTQKKTV